MSFQSGMNMCTRPILPKFTPSPKYAERDAKRAERRANGTGESMISKIARVVAYILLVPCMLAALALGAVIGLLWWLAKRQVPHVMFGPPAPQDVCWNCASEEEIAAGVRTLPVGQGYRTHNIQGEKVFGRSVTMDQAVAEYADEEPF